MAGTDNNERKDFVEKRIDTVSVRTPWFLVTHFLARAGWKVNEGIIDYIHLALPLPVRKQ
jgi:hypothetical protein